jgi:ribosomal protein L17
MRHKHKQTIKLNTGIKKKSVFKREMLTNLVRTGRVVTTPKRAKVLKADADSFFAHLIDLSTRYENEKDGRREAVAYTKSIIFGNVEGKKVVDEYLPRYLEEKKRSSFVENYKLGVRK